MSAERPLRGIVLFVLGMLAMTCQDAFFKLLVADYAVAQIVALRYAVLLAIALWLTRREGVARALATRHLAMQVVRGLVLVLDVGCFVLAVRHLPLADAHAIVALSPLIALVLAIPLLGEHVGRRRWTAVLVGFVGMMVVLRPQPAGIEPGMIFAVGAAVFFALYNVLTRRAVIADGSTPTILYTALVGVAVTGCIAPWSWHTPDLEGWLLFAAMGVLGALGQVLTVWASRDAQLSLLQPFVYTQLVWAVLLGLAVFGDLPDAATLVGAAFIVAGGVYAALRRRRAQRASA
jgi:drug/metabolite transporter (DMT)-like permease